MNLGYYTPSQITFLFVCIKVTLPWYMFLTWIQLYLVNVLSFRGWPLNFCMNNPALLNGVWRLIVLFRTAVLQLPFLYFIIFHLCSVMKRLASFFRHGFLLRKLYGTGLINIHYVWYGMQLFFFSCSPAAFHHCEFMNNWIVVSLVK